MIVARAAVVAALAGCGGQVATDSPASPSPHALPPIANVGRPVLPLPTGCDPRPPYAGEPPWQRWTGIDCAGVARAPDGGWVVLTWDAVTRYDRDGRARWRADLVPQGTIKCGAPAGIAVDADGRVALACGYSLLSYAADGALRWQVWPGGNNSVGPPVVDTDGTIYVGVGGTLYAVAPDDGTTRWKVGTGFNRWFGSIAPTPSGDLMIETTMYALHSDDDGSGYQFYYDYEPPELIVIDRRGTIVRRETRVEGDDHWPEWVDLLGEGGGRLPAR